MRSGQGWRGITLLMVTLAAAALPVEGRGGKEKKPLALELKLPPGCVRLVKGRHGTLSADGKRLAFARETLGAMETWVRDLKAKREWKLQHVTMPVGWTDSGTLLLRLGFGVDPVKGVRVAKVAALATEELPWALAWTPDGARLAYVRSMKGRETTAVHWITAGGTAARLTSTDGIRTDQAVRLAWSPDGTRLYVNGLFQRGDDKPWRRIGVVDLSQDALHVVAEMPDWSDLPGLHGMGRIYRDPRAEDPSPGRQMLYLRPDGPGDGPEVWSGSGAHFAWLAGHGWTEADAFVADAAGTETWRLTNDGEAKWSPALDAASRRLAFLSADDGGNGGTYKNPLVRVVDLRTDTLVDLPIPHDKGIPGELAWTADGTQVLYEIAGGAYEGTYLQAVPPAKPAPEGAPIRRVDILPTDRVRAWLASYDADRVHAAVHRAEDAWDPVYISALRETLATWALREDDHGLTGCLIHLLEKHDAREAIPELRVALGSPRTWVLCAAAELLRRFEAKEALADLKRVLAATTDDASRVVLAAAVAAFGDDAGWEVLAALLQNGKTATRHAVCLELGRIRLPRSVDLLIPLVTDSTTFDPKADPGLRTIGDAALRALRDLTGKSFGPDPAAWKTWWEGEAGRNLPPAPRPPEASEKPRNG